jgi:hypothetical protein
MLQTIEAEVDVYGQVYLLEPVTLSEPRRALVTILEPVARAAAPEAAATLREIAESMRANSFTGDPPRFSREEMYERG